MNNQQFRRLLFDNPQKISADGSPKPTTTTTRFSPSKDASSRSESAASSLGSKLRPSIPMTPRSVTRVDFARQLAEYRRESEYDQQPPAKKFKSSAAPRGAKLPSGYQDRVTLRRQVELDNDRETRVQALEEMVKLGQIDQATFEKLRDEIGIGGNLESTHLVKGLDWKLLQRVKQGEDVMLQRRRNEDDGADSDKQTTTGPAGGIIEADDEFEKVLEEKEKGVAGSIAVAMKEEQREEKVKRGNLAPELAVATGGATGEMKMTRDEILKNLKASRAGVGLAASSGGSMSPQEAPPTELMLGSKFRKIGARGEKRRWIESDEKTGRRKEILVTTDAEGKVKRKVRWLDKPNTDLSTLRNGKSSSGLLALDKDAKPLGMDIPAEVLARVRAEAAAENDEDDGDIFEGVGADYNPLADLEDGDESSADSADEKEKEMEATTRQARQQEEPSEGLPQSRNYFSATATSTTSTVEADGSKSAPLTSDPTILAALKRAAAIRQTSPSHFDMEGDDDEADPEAILHRKKFLEDAKKREREDAMDVDLGFGESRFGDEDEEEYWDEGAGGKGAQGKRKRGKKKRGDKNGAGAVLKVLEGRRKSSEKR